MTARTAEPLPECRAPGCDQPVGPGVWEANGGLCTRCADSIAATVRMLPATPGVLSFGEARRRKLLAQPSPHTAFVEGYRPPVPGPDPVLPPVEFGVLYPEEIEQEAACRWAHGPQTGLDRRGRCAVCSDDDERQQRP